MNAGIADKLRILAEGAKYDVSCSTSGVERKNSGRMGNASCAGICHSWSADGRCISLLKVLLSNDCVYNCAYCVNRRTADCERASFEPLELAALTMEFYRRNYIEGLFLSSAVLISPDCTAERMLECLRLLREVHGFSGYIHAKVIPGTSKELLFKIGLVADRLSVNLEFPSPESLALLAPQKKPASIFNPMKQITNTLIEQRRLKGPGTMFKGSDLNNGDNYLHGPDLMEHQGRSIDLGDGSISDLAADPGLSGGSKTRVPNSIQTLRQKKEPFAPAGQTTQMIIGAGGETDRDIVLTSEKIYHTFKVKRVYFSAYIPLVESPLLPAAFSPPQLKREHRLYQADWLLRFYGFNARELFDERNPNLDPDLDPKITWALNNISSFPIEINKASLDELLRIPGIGTLSALRIVKQRRFSRVCYEDLKKMGVVLKRARYFLTCNGKYYGGRDVVPEFIRAEALKTGQGFLDPEGIRGRLAIGDQGGQISMFEPRQNLIGSSSFKELEDGR